MSLKFVAKRSIDTYEHVPLPGIVISHIFRYKTGTADIIEDLQTWTLTGYLVAPEGSIAAQVAELTAFYEGGELDYARFQDNSTIVDEVPIDTGIKIVSLEFPEGDGPEWATKRKYIIVLEGITYPTNITSSGDIFYTITYSTNQSGVTTRTIRGRVTDLAGESAYTKYTTLKSTMSWSTWATANLMTDEHTLNDGDTECTFTIVHGQYWAAFPAGITNANVDYSTRRDNKNVVRGRTSGWFEGSTSDCAFAVAGVYPMGSVVLDYDVTRNYGTNRTTFSISYISLFGNDVLEYNETLVIESQIYDFVYHRVLGGAPPVRQITSRTTARATQVGSMTMLKVMPPAPIPKWDPMYIKSHRLSQSSAEHYVDGYYYQYTLSWSYVYEFPTDPVF